MTTYMTHKRSRLVKNIISGQNCMQAGNIAGGSSHIAIFDPIVTADQLYSSATVSGGGAMAINWISISFTKFALHQITSHAVLSVTNMHNFACKAPTSYRLAPGARPCQGHPGLTLKLAFFCLILRERPKLISKKHSLLTALG